MRLVTALLLCGLCAPALAQTPGTCETGSAELNLAVSDVLARLFNTGSLFFGNTTVAGDGYLVPKDDNTSPVFAAGIWIGGLVGGDVRVAGSTYDDFEFWPGPLSEDGSLPDPDDCSAFDRFWLVDPFDLALYEATGEATGDLLNWPVDLGAPVIDGDGVEGNYNLEGGDRPEVYGHQTAFWVMNDVGNTHTNSLTEPIGLEVRVTAFTSLESTLDRHTFYRYEVVNRNDQPFEAARFGFFADVDLGDAVDDYVGSDSTRGMAFVYNGDNEDVGGFNGGYGMNPPAFGFDFLTGAEVSMYLAGVSGSPTSDPINGPEMYNFLRALWRDGTPLTEGGDGYMTGGPILTWVYPGDPVTAQFWSEVNIDGEGNANVADDRRHIIASPAFTLAPGEARTFDLALLFAQGDDHIDSVAELQAISDAVQTRYDAGEIFAPSALEAAAPGTLAAPELLAPEDGAFIVGTPDLQWTDVPGAEYYRIDFATEPDFSDRTTRYGNGSGQAGATAPIPNEVTTYHWRVQAVAGLEQSFPSEPRSYTVYRFEAEYFGEDGERIVETAHPAVAGVCADAPADPGCADERAPGNTVWRDPNSTGDYVLTNSDNDLGDLLRDVAVVDDDDFEIRFTEACATPGACLGVYSSRLPGGSNLITSVPFELWNVRRGLRFGDDPADDLRMIPMLRPLDGTEPAANWADVFPAEQTVIAGSDTLALPVTHRVIGVMPDRADGYALFEAAALGFGGVGATYDPETDGDEQVDPGPEGTGDCRSQDFYADFCYRGNSNRIVAPVGGLDGLVLADLAGDGTTPPAGTVIRFVSNDRLFVDGEDDVPAAPQAFALGSAFPNPFRTSATVPFEVERAGPVRLSVFDVLGRRVAMLLDGDVAAGTHRATLDGTRLATGVYLVVLEADGQRQAKKVLLVR